VLAHKEGEGWKTRPGGAADAHIWVANSPNPKGDLPLIFTAADNLSKWPGGSMLAAGLTGAWSNQVRAKGHSAPALETPRQYATRKVQISRPRLDIPNSLNTSCPHSQRTTNHMIGTRTTSLDCATWAATWAGPGLGDHNELHHPPHVGSRHALRCLPRQCCPSDSN